MAVQNEGGIKAFTASGALAAWRRVQLVASSGTEVEYAGADEEFIGVTQAPAADGESVAVRLRGMSGTFKVEAAGAITAGAAIYGASSGRIDDTASGQAIGTDLTATAAAGGIAEVTFDALAVSSVGGSVGLLSRYALIERFLRAPKLNADIQNAAEATRMIANSDFEVLGTNMTSALSVGDVGGGVLLTTAGADGDGAIILPHLDANQSIWTKCVWPTDKSLEWECLITTGSAGQIGNAIIWAGLKLTNTDVIITDADQVFFRYENGVNGGKFQCTTSNTGVDDTDDSGVAVAAATSYHLQIIVDGDRDVKMLINGALVATPTGLKTGINLIPYIAIEADGAAEAKILMARYQALSRLY